MPQKLKPAVRKNARTLKPSGFAPGSVYSRLQIRQIRNTFKKVAAKPP